MSPRERLLCLAAVAIAGAVSPRGTHAQVRSSVTLGPHGIAVSAATDLRRPARVDLRATQNGYPYGRATVLVPDGVSTSYGLQCPDGAAVLRSVHMAVEAGRDVFGSGTLVQHHAGPQPVGLGGGFRLGRHPLAEVWADDQSGGREQTRVRMRAAVDADRKFAGPYGPADE